MSPQATARLRAVRDCGVLRVGLGFEGMEELARENLVAWKQIGEDRADCWLTDYGRAVAAKLPSGMVYR
jgi:hypothetical protein